MDSQDQNSLSKESAGQEVQKDGTGTETSGEGLMNQQTAAFRQKSQSILTADSSKSQESQDFEPINQQSPSEFQIKFYGQFAEKAVANLQCMKEKVLAARWVLMLEKQPISETRAEYLKQLLFVCLHGRLAGIFAEPPQQESIEPLPEYHTIKWLSKKIRILREKDKVPVQQELSESRMEYLAIQNIPYFGTQFFFAVSDDPIENWENAPRN